MRKWWVSVDFTFFPLFILKLCHFIPTVSAFRCQIREMPERILHFLIGWSPSIMDTSECKLPFIHCHRGQCYLLYIATHKWFPGGSDDKESACNERDPDQSLDWKDPLEKEMATHCSILAWRIPMDREAWWATVHRVAKSQMSLKWLSMHASVEKCFLRFITLDKMRISQRTLRHFQACVW